MEKWVFWFSKSYDIQIKEKIERDYWKAGYWSYEQSAARIRIKFANLIEQLVGKWRKSVTAKKQGDLDAFGW